MLHIALHQPEIPPNTGNIIRLCANSGAQLHLIHPLGFTLEDKRMRRAGLDYHEFTSILHYDNTESFIAQNHQRRIFSCTTKTTHPYNKPIYQDGDLFLFGSETKGLPKELRQRYTEICIPMKPESRSLNLSNSVAIILFEAWQQLDFKV